MMVTHPPVLSSASQHSDTTGGFSSKFPTLQRPMADRESPAPPTAAAVPPVIRTSSSNEVGNTVCGCPAAAHTTSYFASHTSTSVRRGEGCPTGPTPPMTCPVQDRTDRASARETTEAPTSAATREVSTRCAPLVITSNGAPSAANTRLFAIAPTSHPSCAAASAAVDAESGSTRTAPATPSSPSTLANREKSTSAMPPSYRSSPPTGQSNYPERIQLPRPRHRGPQPPTQARANSITSLNRRANSSAPGINVDIPHYVETSHYAAKKHALQMLFRQRMQSLHAKQSLHLNRLGRSHEISNISRSKRLNAPTESPA